MLEKTLEEYLLSLLFTCSMVRDIMTLYKCNSLLYQIIGFQMNNLQLLALTET